MKKNKNNSEVYNRSLYSRIKDYLYEFIRKTFYKNPKNKSRSFNKGKVTFLVVMLVIPILHWLIFWLYVNINSIALAFKSNIGEWSFIQFKILFNNFKQGASYEEGIFVALKNTLLYFCNNLFVITPLAFIISYFFYKKIKFYTFFRVIIYLPVIVSAVAMTSAFSNLISPQGPFGKICEILKIYPIPELLQNSDYATKTIIFYTTCTGLGTPMLLFSGAMARIPQEVIEAGQIDGCSSWIELWKIVFPMIWSSISTQLILIMTSIFVSSGPILLFTAGKSGTTTISYWIFDKIYDPSGGSPAYGEVSAAGLFFTVIGVPIILFIRYIIEKVPKVEY